MNKNKRFCFIGGRGEERERERGGKYKFTVKKKYMFDNLKTVIFRQVNLMN